SHALGYAVTSIVLMALSIPVNGESGALFGLLGLFLNWAGIFSVKQTMEACFNRQFNGFLSFFLGPIYFQYHFDKIPKDRREALMTWRQFGPKVADEGTWTKCAQK